MTDEIEKKRDDVLRRMLNTPSEKKADFVKRRNEKSEKYNSGLYQIISSEID